MKRMIALLLALLMALSLCACGGGGASKAVIVDNEGNTVEMTLEELKKAFKENDAKARKLYLEAPITLVGTIEEIKGGTYINGSSICKESIVLKEGCTVYFIEGSHDDIVMNAKVGDKIQVKSEISSGFMGFSIEVESVKKFGSGPWTDCSEITLVK